MSRFTSWETSVKDGTKNSNDENNGHYFIQRRNAEKKANVIRYNINQEQHGRLISFPDRPDSFKIGSHLKFWAKPATWSRPWLTLVNVISYWCKR